MGSFVRVGHPHARQACLHILADRSRKELAGRFRSHVRFWRISVMTPLGPLQPILCLVTVPLEFGQTAGNSFEVRDSDMLRYCI